MLENYTLRKNSLNENHIRWNCEYSRDSEDKLLYHFVVLGDKNYRNSKLNRIFEGLGEVQEGVEFIREPVEGTSKNKRKYVLTSVESRTSSSQLGWENIETDKKRIVRDEKLREKHMRGYSIEDYVADMYNK